MASRARRGSALPLSTPVLRADGRTISDVAGMKAAAEELHRYGPQVGHYSLPRSLPLVQSSSSSMGSVPHPCASPIAQAATLAPSFAPPPRRVLPVPLPLTCPPRPLGIPSPPQWVLVKGGHLAGPEAQEAAAAAAGNGAAAEAGMPPGQVMHALLAESAAVWRTLVLGSLPSAACVRAPSWQHTPHMAH